jgi:hypothetical protein
MEKATVHQAVFLQYEAEELNSKESYQGSLKSSRSKKNQETIEQQAIGSAFIPALKFKRPFPGVL